MLLISREGRLLFDIAGHGLVELDGTSEVDDVDKSRYGCGRSVLTGKSFAGDAPLVWMSTGRRNVCLECHSCWRTCYSSEHSLPFFQKWLKEPANQVEWEILLIAFITLPSESDRITHSMVAERASVIKLVLKLLGFPSEPFVVIELEALSALDSVVETSLLQPQRLVTIRSLGGDKLGLMLPTFLAKDAPGFHLRPNVQRRAATLLSRQPLSTARELDLKFLYDHVGEAPAASGGPSGQLVLISKEPAKSPLQVKLSSMTTQPGTLCEQFCTED